MKHLTELVLRLPRTVIAATVLAVLLLATLLPGLEVDPSVKSMLPEDFPVLTRLHGLEQRFGGTEIVVFAIESDDLFSEHTLALVRRLTLEAEEQPWTERVVSLANAKDIVGTEAGFEARDLVPGDRLTPEEVRYVKGRIAGNDMLRGSIVSEDLSHTAVVVMLKADAADDDVVAGAQVLAGRHHGPERLVVAGLPMVRSTVARSIPRDMRTFLPFGIALMLILLALCFRSWIGVVLPLAVVIASVVTVFGAMALLGVKVRMISVVIPAVLIAVANDYGIHIVAHYLHELRHDPTAPRAELVRRTMARLGVPILLAGLTTVAGLLTLLAHLVPAAREMGVMGALGICTAFLLSMTLIPAAMVLLPRPPAHEGGGDTPYARGDRLFDRFSAFVVGRRIPVIAGCAVLVAAAAFGIPRVVVDTDPVHYFRPEMPVRRAMEDVDRMLGGSSQMSVLVQGDIKDPALLARMRKLSEFLRSRPQVSGTLSLHRQLELMNRAMHADDPAWERLPDSRDLVAQYLLLYSMSGDEADFEKLVDFEYRHAQVVARVNTTSSTAILDLLSATERYLDENLSREEFPFVSGFVTILGTLINMVVEGQVYSLLLSAVLVLIICAAAFRSLVAGLLCSVPLAAAITLLFGLMGSAAIELNMATAMLSSVIVGVGVDYTIHFAWHYREAVREGLEPGDAVAATMRRSGRGIVFNALSVMVGFVVLLLSDFLPVNFFGFLIVVSIGACLVGALTLLPALLVALRPRFIHGPPPSAPALEGADA